MAYQSIKKGLPDSCKCMESSLLDGLVANIVGGRPPKLPSGYLAFVKREVRRIFSKGWDTSYEGYCRRFAPPLKGVLESGRSTGGALGNLRNSRGITNGRASHDHASYLEVSLFGRDFGRSFGQLKGALQVVQSAGKPRPLTTFSADGHFLRPLHKAIYSHLSKEKWMSRGDISADSLRRAGFRKDLGTLTSGDYASATDNLSIEVMECAIEAMLENVAIVPPNIREFALSACRPFLYASREEYEEDLLLGTGSSVGVPRKGQMMGSYLSFPLLCLQNYLAFRWSTRRAGKKIPVIINGDDILFQSSPAVSKGWMDVVGSLGLQVELTKTSVDDNYGSLNSTLLRWSRGELVVVPTLRFGMLRNSEYPNALGQSFSSFLKGISGPIRWRAGHVFFEAHLGSLKSTSWSLPSLGFFGGLAHRLARVFGLLCRGRMVGEPPAAPISHSVCLPSDLISEVPNEFVDSELVEVSSCETASWKWSVGFSGADKVSSAIRYAIASTSWSNDRDVTALLVGAMSCTDTEFSFKYRGGGLLTGGVSTVSRRNQKDSFYTEKPARCTTRLFYRVVSECLLRSDQFNCPLPTYDEAVGG